MNGRRLGLPLATNATCVSMAPPAAATPQRVPD